MASQQFVVSWTWTFESPVHCGAGLSRPGVADALILRDPRVAGMDAPPWLTGDAVKGALRMSAEQVASWLGKSQTYEAGEPAEPKARPLALLFGGDAMAHVGMPQRIIAGDATQTRVQVLASTAIDRSTGTADPQSLRQIEALFGAEQFRIEVSVDVDASDAKAVETLLLAAVSATEVVGAKGGIGWGRVKHTDVIVRRGETQLTPAEWAEFLSKPRLDHLQVSLDERRSPFASWVAPATKPEMVAEPFAWYQLRIDLHEPTSLPSAPEISNHLRTDVILRASTLRGALAREWRRTGVGIDKILARLGDRTRWSPGLPTQGGRCFFPAPLSFQGAKRQARDEDSLIIDGLRRERPRDASGQPLQTKVLGGFVRYDADAKKLVQLGASLTETRMHVHRDWSTGSKRAGALFSRERLIAGRTGFVAWALVPPDAAPPNGTINVTLGKRPSAGSGSATITMRPVAMPDLDEVLGPIQTGKADPEMTDRDVIVELVSPAIVRGKHGHPLRSLSVTEWRDNVDLRDVGLIVESTTSSLQSGSSRQQVGSSEHGSWMSTWGHPRGRTTTVAAGSVWRFRCDSAPHAEELREKLRTIRQIGERQHEGFGWLAVDPTWIRLKEPALDTGQLMSAGRRPSGKGKRQEWPGCQAADRDRLMEIVGALDALGPLSGLGQSVADPLHELARRAARAETSDDVHKIRDFCKTWAQDHPERWGDLKEGTDLWNVLDLAWRRASADPSVLRFAIDAVTTRVISQRER